MPLLHGNRLQVAVPMTTTPYSFRYQPLASTLIFSLPRKVPVVDEIGVLIQQLLPPAADQARLNLLTLIFLFVNETGA